MFCGGHYLMKQLHNYYFGCGSRKPKNDNQRLIILYTKRGAKSAAQFHALKALACPKSQNEQRRNPTKMCISNLSSRQRATRVTDIEHP